MRRIRSRACVDNDAEINEDEFLADVLSVPFSTTALS